MIKITRKCFTLTTLCMLLMPTIQLFSVEGKVTYFNSYSESLIDTMKKCIKNPRTNNNACVEFFSYTQRPGLNEENEVMRNQILKTLTGLEELKNLNSVLKEKRNKYIENDLNDKIFSCIKNKKNDALNNAKKDSALSGTGAIGDTMGSVLYRISDVVQYIGYYTGILGILRPVDIEHAKLRYYKKHLAKAFSDESAIINDIKERIKREANEQDLERDKLQEHYISDEELASFVNKLLFKDEELRSFSKYSI